jgi:hypothetical protein
MGKALSAVLSIPVTVALFQAAPIPTAAATATLAAAAVAIVMWHLRRGGRAQIRRARNGTVTISLDSTRKTGSPRRLK